MLNWPEPIDDEPQDHACERVFHWARRLFIWTPDMVVFQMPEFWATKSELEAVAAANHGLVPGDCDDFAGLCVIALRALGFDARYLTCNVETGEFHAVAECGETILCNRQRGVQSLNFTRRYYQLVGRSGPVPGSDWREFR